MLAWDRGKHACDTSRSSRQAMPAVCPSLQLSHKRDAGELQSQEQPGLAPASPPAVQPPPKFRRVTAGGESPPASAARARGGSTAAKREADQDVAAAGQPPRKFRRVGTDSPEAEAAAADELGGSQGSDPGEPMHVDAAATPPQDVAEFLRRLEHGMDAAGKRRRSGAGAAPPTALATPPAKRARRVRPNRWRGLLLFLLWHIAFVAVFGALDAAWALGGGALAPMLSQLPRALKPVSGLWTGAFGRHWPALPHAAVPTGVWPYR